VGKLTGRETLLVFLAAGIALLLSMFVSAVYRHQQWPAIVCFTLAMALMYIFFRHRKVVLTLTALSFLLVNVGLNNLFHPSVPGYLVTYGSAVGMCLIVWWRARKRSQLGRKSSGPQDMHKLFDKDTGDAL
jgi:branched-subunit amino acid permease